MYEASKCSGSSNFLNLTQNVSILIKSIALVSIVFLAKVIVFKVYFFESQDNYFM